ncbi:hypothetical protein D9M71_231070 [compost metagenome]
MRRVLVEVARLHAVEQVDQPDTLVQAVAAERPVVAHRTGVETAAQAGFAGIAAAVAALARQGVEQVAVVADQEAVGGDGLVVALPSADRGEGGQVLAEVVLAAGHQGVVLLVEVGVAQAEAGARVRRVGYTRGVAGQNRAHHALEALLLVQQIAGQAQSLAAEIQRQRGQRELAALVGDRGVTIAIDAVEAHAEGVALAEAAADIEVGADLRILAPVDADAGQRLVGGALGHDVDRAADATARRHAAEQRVRPLEQLDPLGELDRHPPEWQHAVQAVERGVGAVHREAAHGEGVDDIAAAADHPHRGVVGHQQVGDAACLLVLDGLFGIAGDAERRVHDVGVAQHAQARALGHLAAGILGRQRFRAADGGAGHGGCGEGQGVARQAMQHVAAVGLALDAQAAAGEQRGEALVDPVAAVQAGGAQATGQLGIERQRHSGGAGEAADAFRQRAGGDVEVAQHALSSATGVVRSPGVGRQVRAGHCQQGDGQGQRFVRVADCRSSHAFPPRKRSARWRGILGGRTRAEKSASRRKIFSADDQPRGSTLIQ